MGRRGEELLATLKFSFIRINESLAGREGVGSGGGGAEPIASKNILYSSQGCI